MRQTALLAVVVTAMGLMIGCETAPKTPQERSALKDDAQSTFKQMTSQDPSLDNFINNRAYGYAIFPSVGAGGAIVGGAHGQGVVYEQGRFVGYCELEQASIGAQLGGQSYSEILVFENRDVMQKFQAGHFDLGANASAVALKAGAAAAARFDNGVAVFVHPKGGLMAGVSINGQKFNFRRPDDVRNDRNDNMRNDNMRSDHNDTMRMERRETETTR